VPTVLNSGSFNLRKSQGLSRSVKGLLSPYSFPYGYCSTFSRLTAVCCSARSIFTICTFFSNILILGTWCICTSCCEVLHVDLQVSTNYLPHATTRTADCKLKDSVGSRQIWEVEILGACYCITSSQLQVDPIAQNITN